jgi:hypothetical protein
MILISKVFMSEKWGANNANAGCNRKIAAHSVRERRLYKRRKYLKFMWRRECRTAGRLHSLVKLRKRYVKNFSYIDIELNKSYRIYIDFELLLVCSQTQLLGILFLCFSRKNIPSSKERARTFL